ncbi:tetratricopeptide repeat protein [Dongia sp.]|uniref:tetratricopeptide repeat protein n=1 Tax=Dongia sp. TaxID=1977262 RepID=UPI0035B1F06E
MKTPILPLSTALGALLLLMSPGLGQEATPLPPPPGSEAAAPLGPLPPSATDAAALPGPALPEGTVVDSRACKRPVFVDGIPYTWDKLERDADDAWVAYGEGKFVQAIPVFEKLARIGHPVAQRLMGIAYFYGQGVPLDYRTSLAWFEKAAMQGCFEALAPTAQMYEEGRGAAPDSGKAYMWYNIAAAQLPQGKDRREMVERREKVAETMTPAQVEAAQKRSLQYAPKLVVPPDISELPEDFFKKR